MTNFHENPKKPTWLQKRVLQGLVFYRTRISPLKPPSCKFYPTCSTYAVVAVQRFGAIKGGLLALLRLLRCRPWSDGGIDDVPHRFSVFYRFSWSSAHEEERLVPEDWIDKAQKDVINARRSCIIEHERDTNIDE